MPVLQRHRTYGKGKSKGNGKGKGKGKGKGYEPAYAGWGFVAMMRK